MSGWKCTEVVVVLLILLVVADLMGFLDQNHDPTSFVIFQTG